MSTFTSQNAAMAIVKLVASKAVAALSANLVMGALVNRDFEPALASYGDQINIPIPPVLAANNVAESGTVTPQAVNLGNAQITLNAHKEATFDLPDVTKVLAVPDLAETLLQPAIIAIAEQIETDLLNLYANATVNAAVGGATTLDEARIDLAETKLFGQKVPKTQPKFLIMNGGTYGAARQIERFSAWTELGENSQPSAMITGMLPGGVAEGRLKDFWVFRSQLVPNVSGTIYNLAFARDGIALAMRRLPQPLPGTGAIATYAEMGGYGLRVVMSYQSGALAQRFTVDALYGCAILRNNFVVPVKTNNT